MSYAGEDDDNADFDHSVVDDIDHDLDHLESDLGDDDYFLRCHRCPQAVGPDDLCAYDLEMNSRRDAAPCCGQHHCEDDV